jgi:hypothetical protein
MMRAPLSKFQESSEWGLAGRTLGKAYCEYALFRGVDWLPVSQEKAHPAFCRLLFFERVD